MRSIVILAVIGATISAGLAAPIYSVCPQLGEEGRLEQVEQFKKHGFHSLWLAVDYEKVDPATKTERPDVLMKQAARKFLADRLTVAGIDVHLTYTANAVYPRLSVNLRSDSARHTTGFEARLVDYPEAEDLENEAVVWEYKKEQRTKNKADTERILGEIADEFLVKFKPYIRDGKQ